MKKFAVLSLLSVLVAGCPPKDEGGTEQAARDSLPAAENVKIDLPAGAMKPIVGQVAPTWVLTVGTAIGINGSVGIFLTMIRIIVAFPVTSVEGDTWIWGPWHEDGKPGEYRLTVRYDDGEYVWTLEGRLFGSSAAFQTVATGRAMPGRPGRGSGVFTLDFDVAKVLDPTTNADGTLSATYDLESQPITLTVDAEKLAPKPGGGSALTTFHYTYSENADRSGDLAFTAYGDTDDPGSAWETSDFHSRWQAGGAGRADVRITGGDLGAATATLTECWNTTFRRTYYTDSFLWTPTEGSASSCVF